MAVKVARGSVLTSALNYALASAQTIAKGDLIRITSAGTIKIATATACHGIALKNGATTATADGETLGAGDLFPVALFDNETIIAIPLPSGVDVDAGTVVKGQTYTIDPTTQAHTPAC